MIQLKEISFSYNDKPLIRGLNLQFEVGKLTCLLGSSGCGKSTILRLIAGLEVPSTGAVYIDNKLVAKDRKNITMVSKRSIGFIFQELALWPHMTAYQNVAFGLQEQKKTDVKEKVLEILAFFGLSEYIDNYPNEMSGGQKQLLAIARSLVLQPKVLLMDEPLSNLDVKLKHKILGYIKKLKNEFDLTIVYVTHDHKEAFAIADQVVLMNEGRVIEQGTTEEIVGSANEFVKEFIEY
ncbi:MAG: ABC transporter ATP-binding protein [Bacteroidales bacterium]|nr:ABC transporter ATP-binding protein [Bacteroidales bacterium]